MLELQGMRPGEKVEVVLRRHWIIYVMLFVYFFLFLVFTLVLFYFFGTHPLNLISMTVMWLYLCLFLYMEWLNHELDLFVITNNRVIWIEQVSFLDRSVSECNLGQVQEVNANTKGFFSNMLNYGTVRIQTAWATANMVMAYVPDPLVSQRKVLNIVDAYRDAHDPRGDTSSTPNL